jgi:hypothetical protein
MKTPTSRTRLNEEQLINLITMLSWALDGYDGEDRKELLHLAQRFEQALSRLRGEEWTQAMSQFDE